ncbi:hypothetical protein EG68_12164, partial [Paragonimus skrjabini miyazakii]
MAVQTEAECHKQRAAEIIQLTHSNESQTQQIMNLQQKLLDIGDRIATNEIISVGSSDQTSISRLAQLHNIQETRVTLRYLFNSPKFLLGKTIGLCSQSSKESGSE